MIDMIIMVRNEIINDPMLNGFIPDESFVNRSVYNSFGQLVFGEQQMLKMVYKNDKVYFKLEEKWNIWWIIIILIGKTL